MLMLAPFAGFTVGGGGHSSADYNQSPPPNGTGPNAGPARTPLRILGQDGRPLKKRFIKVTPPGQYPAMAPPYSWEPHERADWAYPWNRENGRYPNPKRTKSESTFFSSRLLIELELRRPAGVATQDPAKQQIIQLHVRTKLIRNQIAALREKAHQLVQTHRQKQQQARQFKAAETQRIAAQRQASAQAHTAAQSPRAPRSRPAVNWGSATGLGKKVASSISRYRTLRGPVAVAENEEPYGLEGGEHQPYAANPDRGRLPLRPPAATSRNPLKAKRQAGAWFMSVGKERKPSSAPVGLTGTASARPADPETQQLLTVHQRVAQLRQQLVALMGQIKQLRQRRAGAS
jgi:TolA-binding protein